MTVDTSSVKKVKVEKFYWLIMSRLARVVLRCIILKQLKDWQGLKIGYVEGVGKLGSQLGLMTASYFFPLTLICARIKIEANNEELS